jgi:predicted ATPase
VPPDSDYRFKHVLIQGAAYENLLKSRRQVLHRRVAEALCDQFAETGTAEPELLAHHFTQAGLTEAAIEWWGKAGLRSLVRSALVEAAQQLTRALGQIATLPATPALRREEIRLQVALITPLIHLKGHAAPETKEAGERARLLIEQADAFGEPPEDPLLLFSVLYGIWVADYAAFSGDVIRELAAQFLAFAERQKASAPLMVGHRMMGVSLLFTGDIAEGRTHLDRAITYYDPASHRPLATRFGQDVRVASLFYRSWAVWMLSYPDAALTDAGHAVSEAREIGQAPTLMTALLYASFIHVFCGSYATAKTFADELVTLAEEKSTYYYKAYGTVNQGFILACMGKPSDAVKIITAGIVALRLTGTTWGLPFYLSYLARAYADLGQFDDACRSIAEATTTIETSKQRLWEAEARRIAGEIAFRSPEHDTAKSQAYFERALAVARKQQAKSWELRSAMSMARLWRDQGKRDEARDLLAPVYGWFTEGFDTLDLKEAKNLLDELSS